MCQTSFLGPCEARQSSQGSFLCIPRLERLVCPACVNPPAPNSVHGPVPHDRRRSSPSSGHRRVISRRTAVQSAERRQPNRSPNRAVCAAIPGMRGRGAPRHRARRREPRAHRVVLPRGGWRCYASLASPPRFMVAFSGINLARICASMSFATSGCCCKKVRALSLPCPMRSPL